MVRISPSSSLPVASAVPSRPGTVQSQQDQPTSPRCSTLASAPAPPSPSVLAVGSSSKSIDVQMKERKMRSETENRTYGKQRLAEAGVTRSYSPDQSASSKNWLKAGFVRLRPDTVGIDISRLE